MGHEIVVTSLLLEQFTCWPTIHPVPPHCITADLPNQAPKLVNHAGWPFPGGLGIAAHEPGRDFQQRRGGLPAYSDRVCDLSNAELQLLAGSSCRKWIDDELVVFRQYFQLKIDQRRREGADAKTAIIDGAKGRFRPIILTSVTTFLGFTPLILERGIQAQFLVLFAASLGVGMMITTGILLLLVPALLAVYLRANSRHRAAGAVPVP